MAARPSPSAAWASGWSGGHREGSAGSGARSCSPGPSSWDDRPPPHGHRFPAGDRLAPAATRPTVSRCRRGSWPGFPWAPRGQRSPLLVRGRMRRRIVRPAGGRVNGLIHELRAAASDCGQAPAALLRCLWIGRSGRRPVAGGVRLAARDLGAVAVGARDGRPAGPRSATSTACSSRASSSASRTAARAAATAAPSTSAAPGSASTNDDPIPGTLAAPRSPRMARARSRAIGSPQPRPGDPLVAGQPHERLEDAGPVLDRDSRPGHPGPPRTRTAAPARASSSTSPPRGVYLIALATRFVTICSTRRRSPVAGGGAAEARRTSRSPAATAIGSSPSRARPAGLGERERGDLQAEAAGLDAAHLEEIADQLRHSLGDPAAALQELAFDPGVGHPPLQSRSR